MRLIELEPRWIHPNVFAFRCPHCRVEFLTCHNAQMPQQELYDIYKAAFGEDWNTLIVPARHDFAWTITGTVPTNPNAAFPEDITVTPSLDASRAGHWHGFITAGEIR